VRDISTNAKAALYAPQTREVFLHLLTFNHADMGTPIRLVDNLTNITSRGNVYTAFPFRALLPGDGGGELPTIEILVDNVSRLLISTVRSIATPADVTVEVIVASDPDVVEAGPFVMQLVNIQYNFEEIRLTLASEQLMIEPYPGRLFTPGDFPMLFRAVRA
jgi:hypothetical protein